VQTENAATVKEAIDRLAEQTGADPSQVAELYGSVLSDLEASANIVSFLPILTERTVRNALPRRQLL
jgi:hypothetical protein